MGKLWGGRWPPSEGGARVMLEGRTGLRFEGEAGGEVGTEGGRVGQPRVNGGRRRRTSPASDPFPTLAKGGKENAARGEVESSVSRA